MTPCPPRCRVCAAQARTVRRIAYSAQRNRALIDPDTLLRIIEGKGRA